MELGCTRSLTAPFIEKRAAANAATAKEVERLMSRYKIIALRFSTLPIEVPTSGLSFFGKKESTFDELFDDDSLNPDLVTVCPVCKEEFKKVSLRKKLKCVICVRIVCSNCMTNSLTFKAMNTEKEVKICDECFGTISHEQKRTQLKQYFALSQKSAFSNFYEEMYFLLTVIERDLPKYRALVNAPLTASSLKKAKEFDETLGQNLRDLEKEIRNVAHFEVKTKKQTTVRDSVKMFYLTALTNTSPEYKVLHKQLEIAATQPLAPERPISPTPVLSPPVSLSTSPPVPSNSTKEQADTVKSRENRKSVFGGLFHKDKGPSPALASRGSTAPYISGINPILSPMSGNERITILGDRFEDGCTVEIGGIVCPVVDKLPNGVVVLSPPQRVSAPQDVCVVNPSSERCLMKEMLFYAEDNMFLPETPSIGESYGTLYNSQSNTIKLEDTFSSNSSTFQTNSSAPPRAHSPNPPAATGPQVYKPPTTSNHRLAAPFSSVPASSTTASTTTNAFQNLSLSPRGANAAPPAHTSAPNAVGVTNLGSRQPQFDASTSIYEDYDPSDLAVKMINPVVSPLEGTKITVELNSPLPKDTTKVRVGGKAVASQVSPSNPNVITFISPPLPAGSTSIEISTAPGRSTLLNGILLYGELGEPKVPSNLGGPSKVSAKPGGPSTSTFPSNTGSAYSAQPALVAPASASTSASASDSVRPGARVWGKRT